MTESKSHANAHYNSSELERLDAIALVLERSASWFPQASASSTTPPSPVVEHAEPVSSPPQAEPAFPTPALPVSTAPTSDRSPRALGKKERRELTRNQRALAAKREGEEKRARRKRRAERRAERLAKRKAESAPPSRPTASRPLASAGPTTPRSAAPAVPSRRERALPPALLFLIVPLVASLLIAWALLRR